MSNQPEDEDLREIQSGIDAERERRQRAREARAAQREDDEELREFRLGVASAIERQAMQGNPMEYSESLARAQQLFDQATAEWRRRRDEREAISRSVSVPFRAEPGASGTLTFHVGGQEVRRIDIGAAEIEMSYGAGIDDASFGASDLRDWVDAYDRNAVPMPSEIAPLYGPALGRSTGRAAYARVARHFYRQRDAALRRVTELEAENASLRQRLDEQRRERL